MEEIKQLYDEFIERYEELKRALRMQNKHLYERWKAGGYLVDDDIISMYPTLGQAIEQLEDNDNEEEE